MIALYVAVGWVALAAVVGLVVGRVIRNRDRQIPRTPPPPAAGEPAKVEERTG